MFRLYFQDWETEEFLQSYRHNLEPSSPPQVDGGGGGGASAEDEQRGTLCLGVWPGNMRGQIRKSPSVPVFSTRGRIRSSVHNFSQVCERNMYVLFPVLWIRIRMDPELFLDQDPAKNERADK